MEIERIEDLYPIVKRLLGAIEPVGDSNVDEIRYRNLDDTIVLISRLMHDVHDVSQYSNRVEHSLKRAGVLANEFIKEIVSEYQGR